jgi:hypothetical protein
MIYMLMGSGRPRSSVQKLRLKKPRKAARSQTNPMILRAIQATVEKLE